VIKSDFGRKKKRKRKGKKERVDPYRFYRSQLSTGWGGGGKKKKREKKGEKKEGTQA